MRAPKLAFRHPPGLLLFGVLSILALGGCGRLLSSQEPPVILLQAMLRRVEGRHQLSVALRARDGELPETATVRFTLHASVSGENGEDQRYSATLEGQGRITESPGDAGTLILTFDSPFPFLPREPTQLSDLTLRSLWRSGSRVWSGELLYPYMLTESLDLD